MDYTHSTPGRLRLRITRLRGQRQETDRVSQALCGVEGVQAVKANHVLGSLLIHYDPTDGCLDRVWSALSRLGCVREEHTPLLTSIRSGVNGTLSGAASRRSDAIVEMFTQKITEASVMAVLNAII